MTKRIVAFAAVVMMAGSMFGQLPPGKWWRRPEVAQRLQLTNEQQSRLDAVFAAAAPELVDRKADVEKLGIALRGELDQAEMNRASLQRIASQLSAARGKLFERELMMLVDMRAVLTEAQWSQLRERLERQRELRRLPPRRR